MDFRDEHCIWCSMRKAPLGECTACPKYRRYHLKIQIAFTVESFCSVCGHRDSVELEVFCRTNRLFQIDSPEDFDCYRFLLAETLRRT